MGPWETRLRAKLQTLAPEHLELTNESDRHRGGQPLEVESHFKLVIVGPAFDGQSRIDRHRLINDLLADELREHVHALGIQAYTPAEWTAKAERAFKSPACGSTVPAGTRGPRD
jgi:BolA protein